MFLKRPILSQIRNCMLNGKTQHNTCMAFGEKENKFV